MVRVVKEVPWQWRFTCQQCRSTLEAEASDICRGFFGANYGGDRPEPRYYVICPVCGEKNFVPDSHVPTVVSAALEKEHR